jgi:hypothetical protein
LANAATEYYTTGLGTGMKGTSESSRLYKSSLGAAAEHKEQFISMLSDETLRTIMLDKGRSAVKTALANA